MSRRRPPRLAARLMVAQIFVIAVGAVALITAAALVAPGLFHHHLALTGETDPEVQSHAEEAFATSFAISLGLALLVSLVAAGAVSWLIVRRVAHPVEELAEAAETLAAGSFDVKVPDTSFSSEISRLTDAFEGMAAQLAETDTTRRQLLSDLAHELRTPLATIEAYIDGLEDSVLAPEVATYDTMRDQVARLRRLAADLREAALAEEHALGLQIAAVDLASVVQAAVAAAGPRFEQAGIALACHAPDGGAEVRADALRLQQVLANLLDNALRHARRRVEVVVASDGGDRVVRVSDDGAGIPPDQLESVFHRFHRVDPSRSAGDGSGSGLGLTIARAIVEDHAGTLGARSPGQLGGADLVIRLPAS